MCEYNSVHIAVVYVIVYIAVAHILITVAAPGAIVFSHGDGARPP